MTLKELINEFQEQGIDLKTQAYEICADYILVRDSQFYDQFICDSQKDRYQRIYEDNRDNGKLRDVFETEYDCIVEALFLMSIRCNDANKEKIQKLYSKIAIEAFSEFVNKYTNITGISYEQYPSGGDYFNKIGKCGIVRNSNGFSWEFVIQDIPQGNDSPHSYYTWDILGSLHGLVRLEKNKFIKRIKENSQT